MTVVVVTVVAVMIVGPTNLDVDTASMMTMYAMWVATVPMRARRAM
jgi:hypothetical protein